MCVRTYRALEPIIVITDLLGSVRPCAEAVELYFHLLSLRQLYEAGIVAVTDEGTRLREVMLTLSGKYGML